MTAAQTTNQMTAARTTNQMTAARTIQGTANVNKEFIISIIENHAS